MPNRPLTSIAIVLDGESFQFQFPGTFTQEIQNHMFAIKAFTIFLSTEEGLSKGNLNLYGSFVKFLDKIDPRLVQSLGVNSTKEYSELMFKMLATLNHSLGIVGLTDSGDLTPDELARFFTKKPDGSKREIDFKLIYGKGSSEERVSLDKLSQVGIGNMIIKLHNLKPHVKIPLLKGDERKAFDFDSLAQEPQVSATQEPKVRSTPNAPPEATRLEIKNLITQIETIHRRTDTPEEASKLFDNLIDEAATMIGRSQKSKNLLGLYNELQSAITEAGKTILPSDKPPIILFEKFESPNLRETIIKKLRSNLAPPSL
jgi:hypothetical protein